ncbi:hypothetical protein Tco_1437670 [Tanacetum coccineum]
MRYLRKGYALSLYNNLRVYEIDIDDLYNNLRVYEDEMKKSLTFSSNNQELGFSLTMGNTNYLLLSCTTNNQYPLENEDFQQMDGDDLEELDLRWQVAMLTGHRMSATTVNRNGYHFAREVDLEGCQGRRPYGDIAMFLKFGTSSKIALMAISSSSSSSSSDSEGNPRVLVTGACSGGSGCF